MQVDQLATKLEDRENKFFDLEDTYNKLSLEHQEKCEEFTALKADYDDSQRSNANLLLEVRDLTVEKENLINTKQTLEQNVSELLQDIRDLKEAHEIVSWNP